MIKKILLVSLCTLSLMSTFSCGQQDKNTSQASDKNSDITELQNFKKSANQLEITTKHGLQNNRPIVDLHFSKPQSQDARIIIKPTLIFSEKWLSPSILRLTNIRGIQNQEVYKVIYSRRAPFDAVETNFSAPPIFIRTYKMVSAGKATIRFSNTISAEEFQQNINILDSKQNNIPFTVEKSSNTSLIINLSNIPKNKIVTLQNKNAIEAYAPLDKSQINLIGIDWSRIDMISHHITADDTLQNLADNYSTSTQLIIMANPSANITPAGVLPVGSEILIPLTDNTDDIKEVLSPQTADLVVPQLRHIEFNGSNQFELTSRWNTKPDIENATDYVRIEPSVKNISLSSTRNGFSINADFKANQQYRITFRKNMPFNNGTLLEKDNVMTLTTPQMRASFEFISDNIIFPAQSQKGLPVRITNQKQVQIHLTHIFPNNILDFYRDGSYSSSDNGKKYSATWEPGLPFDINHTTGLPIKDLIKNLPNGFYKIQTKANSYYERDRTNILISDIALNAVSSKKNITVWSKSLSTRSPMANVQIKVLSRQNQILGQGTSDALGLVEIKLPEGLGEAYMVIAATDHDHSFLPLNHRFRHQKNSYRFPQNTAPQGPFQAMLYSERDFYRPGEQVLFSAIVKNNKMQAAKDLPVQLVIKDSAGSIIYQKKTHLTDKGLLETPISLPKNARLGTYRCTLGLPGSDNIWGEHTFKVFYFEADRIKLNLQADKNSYKNNDSMKVSLDAQFYFGSPAADCRTKVGIEIVDSPIVFPRYKDFTFGNSLRGNLAEFDIKGRTDKDGLFCHDFSLEKIPNAGGLAYIKVTADVKEKGGRYISRTRSFPLHQHNNYFGLRQVNGNLLNFINLNKYGKPLAIKSDLTYKLYNLDWFYVLEEDDSGYLSYKWQQKKNFVRQDKFKTKNLTQGELNLNSLKYGSYLIEIVNNTGTLTTFKFSSDGSNSSRLAHLNFLEMKTNKNLYRNGEQAYLEVDFPADGHALLSLSSTELYKPVALQVKKGRQQIPFTIPVTNKSSLYANLTYIDGRQNTGRFPRRLQGMSHINIDKSMEKLAISISAPLKTKAETSLPVTIALPQESSQTEVQIFAIDKGLLAISGYKIPDPHTFFFGKHAPVSASYDIYNDLIPETVTTGKARIGGGSRTVASMRTGQEFAKAIVLHKPFTTLKPGNNTIELKLPSFSGELQIFAIAVADRQCAVTETCVMVRDAVTLSLNGPKALCTDDRSEIFLQCFNHDLDNQKAKVEITIDGPIALNIPDHNIFMNAYNKKAFFSLSLNQNKDNEQAISLRALNKTGKAQVHITLTVGEVTINQSYSVQIRPNQLQQHKDTYISATKGQELPIPLDSTWIQGSDSHQIIIDSPVKALAKNAVDWLASYPYGCLEQTVSAAFPALFTKDNTSAERLKVQAALRRIKLMHLTAGGYSMWPHGKHLWLDGSLNAIHFKILSREQNFTLDSTPWKRDLEFLRDCAFARLPQPVSSTQRAYALYLLSRSGNDKTAEAIALFQNPFTSTFNKVLCSKSLLQDPTHRQMAETFLTKVTLKNLLQSKTEGEFDSIPRRMALTLDLLLHYDLNKGLVVDIIHRLSRTSREQRYITTQNKAMILLATNAWFRKYPKNQTPRATLNDGDQNITIKGRLNHQVHSNKVSIKPQNNFLVHYRSSGLTKNIKSSFSGIKVKRTYRHENGAIATSFKRGDSIRVELEFICDTNIQNAVINDQLPGGFVIEDNSIKTGWDYKRRSQIELNYFEKLFDRLLLFSHLPQGRSYYSYKVRAVSKGEFHIPPLTAEAMYNPMQKAILQNGAKIAVQ